ncbi:MAG TPA: hypothetical protein VEW47_08580 [Candidatus Dormibacteraeota bacterium]|nr:hypothetical protein [Candidatus Dormibacteraeota bacterium]
MDLKASTSCLCLLLPALSLAADGAAPVRTYDLPGHGRLEFSVPAAWKEEINRPPGDLPPTIEFSPAAGNEFSVQITPLFSPAGDPDYNQMKKIRPLLEEIGRKQLEASVEKEITLQKIKGAEAAGYYFTVTDRAPKKDEWTYLTEGAAGVGDLLVSFTILTNSLDSGELRQALRLIESCRQIKPTDKPQVPPGR